MSCGVKGYPLVYSAQYRHVFQIFVHICCILYRQQFLPSLVLVQNHLRNR